MHRKSQVSLYTVIWQKQLFSQHTDIVLYLGIYNISINFFWYHSQLQMDFKIFEPRTEHNENLSFWWILMNWIDQEWARSSGSKLWHGVYQCINYVLVYKVPNCLDYYNYLCINTKLGQVARMKRYLGDKGKRTYSLSTEFGPLPEASEVSADIFR